MGGLRTFARGAIFSVSFKKPDIRLEYFGPKWALQLSSRHSQIEFICYDELGFGLVSKVGVLLFVMQYNVLFII